ncbi:MAG: hypothetical protein R3C60_15075 [Parvularculaceae bacterium]
MDTNLEVNASQMTDPARELAELCQSLSNSADERGDVYLARHFKVDPWSEEFYRILFCILGRINEVQSLVSVIDADDDLKNECVGHLNGIKAAFNQNALAANWKPPGGPHHLRRENSQPIKMLSPQFRAIAPTPKVDEKEQRALLEQTDELLSWLQNHQLREQDFIRQSIIYGLLQFKFSIEKLRWVGWGYSLKSLRDVIAAYLVLERGHIPDQEDTTYDAMLKLTMKYIKATYERLKIAREITETGDFLLKAYGAWTLISHAPGISGIIGR